MKVPFSVRCVFTAAMLCLASPATAQNTIETSDGFLSLQAQMPQQTRMGDEFTYTIEVTNTSDNVTLYDVKLKQEKAKGFSIESVSVGSESQNSHSQKQKSGQQQKGTANASSNQQQKSDSKSQDSKQKNSKSKDSKQQDSNSEKSKSQDSKQKSDSKEASEKKGKDKNSKNKSSSHGSSSESASSGNQQTMQIDKLEPGESRKIQVKAAADEEGQLRSCLQIVSYRPAICLMSKVVKPELEITKNAPKKVGRCELIELEYIIKNGGTGDVQGIQVTDQLDDGLVTIEGNDRLQFDVDGLGAGETRRFVGRVFAKKSGEFSSRAVAEAKNSDLQSRSKNTTTEVVAAELDVQVQGPNRIYGDELAKFSATVTNNGNHAADNVQVTVRYPKNANLADLSDPTMKNSGNNNNQKSGDSSSQASASQSSGSNSSSSQIDPQPDKNINSGSVSRSDQQQNNQQDQQQDQQVQMAERTFELKSLEPGQTAEFDYAIRPGDREKVPTKVEAVYVCSIDAARDSAEAENRQTATGQASVKIVRLPALQLIVFDDEDPVINGDQVSYTVRVWNEGDAKDQNVKLDVKLPEGLEFASADGPTKHQQNGSSVTFEPLDSIAPGERKEYTLTAKSKGSGNVRLEANLSSEMLSQPVTAEEPTRLFAQNSNN